MLRKPDKRSNISLRQYSQVLRIIKDSDTLGQHEIGYAFSLIWNDAKLLVKEPHAGFIWYYNHMNMLLNTEKLVAPRQLIRIGKKLFGLEPDIQAIEWGAFEDISTLSKALEQGDNVARIMAILYRPVKRGYFKKIYSLKPYTDEPQQSFEARVKLFNEELTLEEVQGAMAFFLANQQRS